MSVLEIILSFVVGGAVAVLLGMVFSLKTKGLLRLLINIAAGCIALALLSLFKVPPFKLNPMSAFIVGLTGVPGLAIVFVIVTFL
jgi:hypothetical protein